MLIGNILHEVTALNVILTKLLTLNILYMTKVYCDLELKSGSVFKRQNSNNNNDNFKRNQDKERLLSLSKKICYVFYYLG